MEVGSSGLYGAWPIQLACEEPAVVEDPVLFFPEQSVFSPESAEVSKSWVLIVAQEAFCPTLLFPASGTNFQVISVRNSPHVWYQVHVSPGHRVNCPRSLLHAIAQLFEGVFAQSDCSRVMIVPVGMSSEPKSGGPGQAIEINHEDLLFAWVDHQA